MAVQVCYQPRVLLPLSHVGETDEMRVQDASAFAARDEELSFWELMVRSLRRSSVCPRNSRPVAYALDLHLVFPEAYPACTAIT